MEEEFTRKPYISYLRVSSDEQRERETIKTQEQQHRLWYQQNGVDPDTDVHWVYDDGVSGAIRIWRRPGGEKLERLIEGGYVTTGALVYNVNRVGRDDTASWFLFTSLCEENGIKPITIQDNLDVSTDAGFVVGGMNAMYSRITKRQAIEHMWDGKARGATAGRWQYSTPPYGHRVKEDLTLEIEPSHMAIVREILRVLRLGMSVHATRKHLTAAGYPTPTGGTEWSHSMIKRIMSNPSLYGQARFRHTLTVTKNGKKKGTPRPESELTFIKCPPLITKEEFDEAQLYLARNRAKYHNDGSCADKVMLTNLRCAFCGGRFYAARRHGRKEHYKDWISYRHAWNTAAQRECRQSGRMPKSIYYEEPVWALVIEAIENPGKWFDVMIEHQPAPADYTEEMEAINKSLAHEQSALERLEDAYFMRNSISPERYDARQKEVQSRILRIVKRRDELTAKIANLKSYYQRTETMAQHLASLRETALNADLPTKRRICDAVIERVEINHSETPFFRVYWMV